MGRTWNTSDPLQVYTHAAIGADVDSDTVDLTYEARGISLVTASDVKITTTDGDTVTIPSGALAVGVIHRIGIKRLWTTGTTTMAGIVLFW